MAEEVRDSSWYVAIMKGAAGYMPFIAAGGESYRNLRVSAERNGLDIVAEQFGITDKVIDKLSPGGYAPTTVLTRLAERLNRGENLNPQAELSKLCEAA